MVKQISGEEHAATTSTMNQTKKTDQRKFIIPTIIAVLIFVVGFFGGIEYQKNQTSVKTQANDAPSQNDGPGGGFQVGPGGGGRMNMRGGIGEVTAISESSISVKDSFNDSTTTYDISDNTTITKDGKNIDTSGIQVGDRAIVQASSSNSKQAARIIINPTMPGNGQGPAGQTQTTDPNIQTN